MINLLSPIKLISALSSVLLLTWILLTPFFEVPPRALIVSLEVLLLGLSYFAWRWIWKLCPKLNEWIFPDLNGTWHATIHWRREGDGAGVAVAQAHIKQNLLGISIEVESIDSDSETLSVTPKKDRESGRAMLHYICRVKRKQIGEADQHSYEGAALLSVFCNGGNELRGNYFTSIRSSGHFKFVRQG